MVRRSAERYALAGPNVRSLHSAAMGIRDGPLVMSSAWMESRRDSFCRPARRRGVLRRGLLAGAVAGIVSGAPSTADALWRGDELTSATRAAGTLLGRPSLPRAALAHLALSLGWGVVLAAGLPRRAGPSVGAAAGAVIAGVDLGLVGRRFPAIAALALGPQLADHLVYGAVVGLVLGYLDEPDPGGPECNTHFRSERRP
jgi:hypothetical protein